MNKKSLFIYTSLSLAVFGLNSFAMAGGPVGPLDGMNLIIECGASSGITLTLSGNGGASFTGTTTGCSSNAGHSFRYRTSNTTWYKDY